MGVECGAKVCTSYGAEDAAELHSKRIVRSRVRKFALTRALRMKLDCAESRALCPGCENLRRLGVKDADGLHREPGNAPAFYQLQ